MDAREHIMETSLSLFYARGCKAVTMDDIASATGISKRTLYEHFSDKEALLTSTLQWWEQQNQQVAEDLSKEAENTLDVMLKIHHFQSEQIVQMSIDLMSDIRRYYPQVFKDTVLVSREQHRERTKAFLLRGQDEGIFRTDINIDLINDFFETMVYYFVHDNRRDGIKKYAYRELFQCTAICFIRGISTAKGIKYLDEHYMNKTD